MEDINLSLNDNKTLEEFYLQISSKAIIDTIEAFFRHPYGFHGDTTIRDFHFHRLMTYGKENLFFQIKNYKPENGMATLLIQSECYTLKPKFKRSGKKSGKARFDIALMYPPEDNKNHEMYSNIRAENLRPMIVFEIGQNKGVKKVIGKNWKSSHMDDISEPADLLKIYHELMTNDTLRHGYVLEFFNEEENNSENMINILKEDCKQLPLKAGQSLTIVFAKFRIDSLPLLWAYPEIPKDLAERIKFEGDFTNNLQDRQHSRIGYDDFLKSCSDDNKVLQIYLYDNIPKDSYELLYGYKTMTVNLRNPGPSKQRRILRIGNNNSGNIADIIEVNPEYEEIFTKLNVHNNKILISKCNKEMLLKSLLSLR